MHTTEVIETYIDDTVRFLPRRQRDDVATELRSLLNEELHALAQEAGRPTDESLALSLVRHYGQPSEVAARYQPPRAIIDPADSTSFLRAAIIGGGALVLLGAISKRLPSLRGTVDSVVTLGMLAWLGLLVVVFGTRSWIRRRLHDPVFRRGRQHLPNGLSRPDREDRARPRRRDLRAECGRTTLRRARADRPIGAWVVVIVLGPGESCRGSFDEEVSHL
jgi:hypothetical protein